MKVSRRKILAGLVAAGVALPAGYYAQQEWQRAQEAELSSDEPAVPVDDLPNALLGERLVGIWDWRLTGNHPALAVLAGPQQLLLDVGQGARALRGYLGTAPYGDRGLQVYGPLAADRLPAVRLKIIAGPGEAMTATPCWMRYGATGARAEAAPP